MTTIRVHLLHFHIVNVRARIEIEFNRWFTLGEFSPDYAVQIATWYWRYHYLWSSYRIVVSLDIASNNWTNVRQPFMTILNHFIIVNIERSQGRIQQVHCTKWIFHRSLSCLIATRYWDATIYRSSWCSILVVDLGRWWVTCRLWRWWCIDRWFEATEEEASLFCDELSLKMHIWRFFTLFTRTEDLLSFVDDLTLLDELLTLLLSTVGFVHLFLTRSWTCPSNTTEDTVIMESKLVKSCFSYHFLFSIYWRWVQGCETW